MSYYSTDSFCPDKALGYLARRVWQLSNVLLEPIYEAEELSSAQWSTLATLYVDGASTAAVLAREIGYDKGAMTRVIDQLETSGFVSRQRDAEDRRIVNLTITEAGRQKAQRVRDKVLVHWNAWVAEFDSAQLDQITGFLAHLKHRLEERVEAETYPS